MLSFAKIDSARRKYIPLLLEADEDIAMLDRYLHKGMMFGLYDNGELVTLAIVLHREDCVELMNIVTVDGFRGRGYGSAMISFLSREFSSFRFLIAGTGDNSPAREFYKRNGFEEYGRRKEFFLQYDHPVIENGRRLVDMVLYRKRLQPSSIFD